MLTELRVRDLAVIADATLPLQAGLNVLTGETGAGKSILVDALALLLGERANTDVIRPDAPRSSVEAVFEVGTHHRVLRQADEAGISVEDDLLIVRRAINREGRNRAWANGSPTTVAVLSRLGRLLVDLHGQHEAQSLLRSNVQRDLLDAYAGAEEDRARVRTAYQRVTDVRREADELLAKRDEIRRRADYLRHVAREIDTVAPVPGEEEQLTVEAQRLAHADELSRLAYRLAELLDGEEETTVIGLLGDARRTFEQLRRIDSTIEEWTELLDGGVAQLEELARAMRDYATEVEVDPARLAVVEARRDQIFRLTQKYGPGIAEVLAMHDTARRELDTLDTADLDLAQLDERRSEADRELGTACGDLTAKRQAASAELSREVGKLLPSLGLPDGKLEAVLEPLAEAGSSGAETVRFLVQLNPGMEARPLAQVASGGELSRLMLALKVVLTVHDAIPTLVFDEVDQGIGGETGAQVAEALSAVARGHQVLVITHLPQIAARAHHHVRITKGVRGGVATANVEVMTGEARVQEVARMLGDTRDPVVRRHAEELLGGKRTTRRRGADRKGAVMG